MKRRDVTRAYPFVDSAGSVEGSLYDAPVGIFPASATATASASSTESVAAAVPPPPPSPPTLNLPLPTSSAAALLRGSDLGRVRAAFDAFAVNGAVPASALSAALRTLGLRWSFSPASFAAGDQALLGAAAAGGDDAVVAEEERRSGAVRYETFAQLCVRLICAAWLATPRSDPDGTADGAAAAAKLHRLAREHERARAAVHRRGRSLTAAEIWTYLDPRATSLLPGGLATFHRLLRARGVAIGSSSATLEQFVVACEIVEAVCVASPVSKRAAAVGVGRCRAAAAAAAAAAGEGPRRVPLPASAASAAAAAPRGGSVAKATVASRARVEARQAAAAAAAAAEAGRVTAQLRRRKAQVSAAAAARTERMASADRRQQLRERREWDAEEARIDEVTRTLRLVEGSTPSEENAAANAAAAAPGAALPRKRDGAAVVDVDGIVAETDRLFSKLMEEM